MLTLQEYNLFWMVWRSAGKPITKQRLFRGLFADRLDCDMPKSDPSNIITYLITKINIRLELSGLRIGRVKAYGEGHILESARN